MNLPPFLVRANDGTVFLKGHRLTLFHIVDRIAEGHDEDAILKHFPTLNRQELRQVADFYQENRSEIDAARAEHCRVVEQQAVAPQPGPTTAELQRRMQARSQREIA